MAQQHYNRKEDIIILTADRQKVLTLNRSRTFYIEQQEDYTTGETYFSVVFNTLNPSDEDILGSYTEYEEAQVALKELFKAIGKGKRTHKMYGW